MPRPRLLPALVAGLLAGACGGSLYDADGVPRLDPGGQACDLPTQHDCGGVCKGNDDPDFCGASCQACPGSPAGGQRTCAPVGAGGAFACDYKCGPGLFKVNGACARPLTIPGSVAAGAGHTCAVVEGGALLCWGANGSGQLGPSTIGATTLVPGVVFTSGVRGVAAGGRHTCAIVGASRNVQCWGANDLGQLGRGSPGSPSAAPAVVGTLADVSQLAAGLDHTCALAAGAVRCWGANAAGQTGTGIATASVAAPGAAAIPGGAAAIAAGGGTTCAITSTGLQCWGDNGSGQTGRGSGQALSPALVAGLPVAPLLAVAVGVSHACALVQGPPRSSFGLWCWGANDSWQLGAGALTGPGPFLAPLQAGRVDNGARADQTLAAGAGFTCATSSLQAPPAIDCGGLNTDLQAGLAPVSPATTPPTLAEKSEVAPGGPVIQLVAGAAHGCALVNDTSAGVQLKCWGRNAEGQLGWPTGGPDSRAGVVPP